ncbi:MAG: hypothetical protein D6743_01995 [Calditrichaeota bacterium]|nr:MAG: hypothetical protein D6743_01995 [Calditrichota bacterium]
MAQEESIEAIRNEIEAHRRAIAELEARLAQKSTGPTKAWPPQGFYLTYYIVAGILLGLLGATVSFVFNVVGSRLVHQDTMQILRVFGTMFIGKDALQTQDLTFLMLVLMVHFSVGAVAGAIFHVAVNRFLADRSPGTKLLLGGGFGLLLWIVNFYLVLSWLQPMAVGEAYILHMMPFWVAALTHLVYGLTLGALQPIGKFIAYQPAGV